MPLIKAQIKITGLACFHLANKEADGTANLQVLFLHPDDRHKLRLSVLKKPAGKTNVNLNYDIERFTRMTLSVREAASNLPNNPVPVEKMVKINDLHKQNPVESPPPLSFKKLDINSPIGLSYLSIPGVKCFTAEISPKPFEFWKIEGDTKTRQAQAVHVGTHLGVEFVVTDSITLTLADRLNPATDGTLTFRNEATAPADYEITFDNACHDHTCSSDFRYYYSILTDGRTPLVEFEELIPFALQASTTTKDVEAACNPTQLDPLPENCTLEDYFRSGNPCP